MYINQHMIHTTHVNLFLGRRVHNLLKAINQDVHIFFIGPCLILINLTMYVLLAPYSIAISNH
jgi:hypothetical protein